MSSTNATAGHYAAMFVAIIAWGLSVPFIEFGLAHISALPFLSYRFLLVSLILTPFVLLYRQKEFITVFKHPWTWVIGISEALGLITQYLGQQQGVPGGLAALLSLCFLLIVPFISPFILDEKLHLYHLIAIITGLIGIIFISTEGDLDNLTKGTVSLLGVALLLIAAFCYALYIVSTSRLTTKEMKGIDTFSLFYTIILQIAVFSTISTLIFGKFQPITKEVWPWLILLGLFSTLIAFFAYFKALTGISANSASVLLLLQVLVPFAVDYIVIGRFYGIWILTGASLIIFSMIIVVGVPYLHEKKMIKVLPT